MIIKQEEGNQINDFIIKYNVEKVLTSLVEMTEQTSVDTDELKVFVQETSNLLKSFLNHIEKVEKEEKKLSTKRKFQELVKKGSSFED